MLAAFVTCMCAYVHVLAEACIVGISVNQYLHAQVGWIFTDLEPEGKDGKVAYKRSVVSEHLHAYQTSRLSPSFFLPLCSTAIS